MQHDEFIGKVQHEAQLDSRGAAESAARATLETLAERLAGGEPSDLASQLPPELGLYLRRTEGAQQGAADDYDAAEFCRRVAERSMAATDAGEGADQAKAVFTVLAEAVSPGQLDHVRTQLPSDFGELFKATA